MGYQALLFCPDEKTARTVTQVLSELEFAVESSTEPFAAVKKLMAEHFDAIVVDCDSEQNASLLFKSARNSTSNQASLAVAVVEGQAGVAKAFRIGANLVLTKPINVEQAKGTLRVARGLLRKGDPAKAAPSPANQSSVPPAAPAAPPKPAPQASVAATPVAARPSAPTQLQKPFSPTLAAPPPPSPTIAASSPRAADDDDVIDVDEPAAPTSGRNAAVPPSPFAPAASPLSMSSASPAAGSAAAPARSPQKLGGEKGTAPSLAPLLEKPSAVKFESSASLAAPSFSFGGISAGEDSAAQGGSKKIFIGLTAAAVVAVVIYAAWAQIHGKTSPVEDSPKPSASATVSTPASPATTSTPKVSAPPAASKPATEPSPFSSPSQPISQPAPQKLPEPVASKPHSPDKEPVAKATSKPSASVAEAPAKTTSEAKAAPQPIVIKNGATTRAPVAASDSTAAPSVMDIAPSASGGSLSNIIGNPGDHAQPVLQTLNISQGVSQGLLIKKVQPSYPPSAIRMQVEGSVQLLATIGKTGNITSVKVMSGEPVLAQAAIDAVKQWKYKPYYLNGDPVEIQTQVTINFKLPK